MSRVRVTIFDYGAGNLHSLAKTLEGEGVEVRVESDPARALDGDALVLPGVGAFEQAAERHEDITFGKVDTEAQQELAGAFQISSIPTLMAIRENVVLYSQAGALPVEALEELISKVREVDMDEVRQKIAEQEQGEGA